MRATTTLLLLVNSLAGYDSKLSGMIAKGSAELGPDDPWRYVLGMIGDKTDPISFDVDDLVPFMKAGKAAFSSELVMLASRYGPLTAAYTEYTTRRDRLLEKLQAVDIAGNRAGGWLTAAQKMKLAPYMAELTQMIQGLQNQTTELLGEARKLSLQMGPLCQAIFTDPRWPVVLSVVPDDRHSESDLA